MVNIGKLKIDEVYILCTKTISDGRIGKFFSDRGILKTYYSGITVGLYYHSDGVSIYPTTYIPKGKTRINPWKKARRKFPREMMVSNDREMWKRAKVFGKLSSTPKPYLTCSPSGYNYKGWKYAKEID